MLLLVPPVVKRVLVTAKPKHAGAFGCEFRSVFVSAGLQRSELCTERVSIVWPREV